MAGDIDFFLDQPYRREVQRTAHGWVARILEIPQVVTRPQPDPTAAVADLESVFADWLSEAVRLHRAVPQPLDSGDYSGSFRFRCSPVLHRALATEARRSGVSLNAFLVDAASRRLGSIAGRSVPSGFHDYVQSGLLSPAHADRLHKALHDGARMLLIGPSESGRTTFGRALLCEMAAFGGSMYTLGAIDPYDEWSTLSGRFRCTSSARDVQHAFLNHYLQPLRIPKPPSPSRSVEQSSGVEREASFEEVASSLFSSDPDPIFVGETRDSQLIYSRVGATPVVYLSSTLVFEESVVRILDDWNGILPSAGLMLVDSRDAAREDIEIRLQLEQWLGGLGYAIDDVADVLLQTGWNGQYGIRSDFFGDDPVSFW